MARGHPLGVHADLLVLVWVQLAVILGLSLFLGFAALKGLFDHFGRDARRRLDSPLFAAVHESVNGTKRT
jgi:hypothetical protein